MTEFKLGTTFGLLIFFTLCTSLSCKAANESETSCPATQKLKNICMTIGGRMPGRDGKNKYLYQTKFYEAACVTSTDTKDVIRRKIRELWRISGSRLKCTATSFDVFDGNILKYAFSEEFEDFLNDVIDWGVDLNQVDISDNQTVLDYVQSYINRARGGPLEQRYRNYYEKLRDAGALHARELQ